MRISLRGGAALRAASSRAFSSSGVTSRGDAAAPCAAGTARRAFRRSSLRCLEELRRSSARRALSSSVRSASSPRKFAMRRRNSYSPSTGNVKFPYIAPRSEYGR